MKKEKKKYDITYENSEKIKSLNDKYFEYYQDLEKYLFKKSKDIVKTNILLSDILDEMIAHQNVKNDPFQLIGKNKQLFIDRIDKKIKYKERIQAVKKTDIQNYGISGLWLTMCGYIVLLFVKELLSGNYLIHYYVDLLVAVIALCIAGHNFLNELNTVKRYQLTMKPIIIEIAGFVVSLVMAIMMYASPFDITFAILVIALITNKKIFEKEMGKL